MLAFGDSCAMLLFHPWFQVGGFIPDFESSYLYQFSAGKVGFFSDTSVSVYLKKFYFLASFKTYKYITADLGYSVSDEIGYYSYFTNYYHILSFRLYRELPWRFYIKKKSLNLKAGLGYEGEDFGDFSDVLNSDRLPGYVSQATSFRRGTFIFYIQGLYPLWRGSIFSALRLDLVSSPYIELSRRGGYTNFVLSRKLEFNGVLNVGYYVKEIPFSLPVVRGGRIFSSVEFSSWPRFKLNFASREFSGWQIGLLTDFSTYTPIEKVAFMVSRKVVLPLLREVSLAGYFELDSLSGLGGGISFAAFRGRSRVFPVYKRGESFKKIQLVQALGRISPRSAAVRVLQNRAPSYVSEAIRKIREVYPYGFSSDPDYVFEINAPSPEVIRIYFKSASGDVLKEFFFEREKGEFSEYTAAFAYVENGKLKVIPLSRGASEKDEKFDEELNKWLEEVMQVARDSYSASLEIKIKADRVSIDGKDLGSAPLTLKVVPGTHTISLDGKTTVLRVYPGKNVLSSATLFSGKKVDVEIVAFPSAKPLLDGRKPDSSVKILPVAFSYRFFGVLSGIHELEEGRNNWSLNILPESNSTFVLVKKIQCKGLCGYLFSESEQGDGGTFFYTPYLLFPDKFDIEMNVNNYGIFAIKFYTAGGTFTLYHDGKHLYCDDSDRSEGIMPAYSLPRKKVDIRIAFRKGSLIVYAGGEKVFEKNFDMKGARVAVFVRSCKIEKMRWSW